MSSFKTTLYTSLLIDLVGVDIMEAIPFAMFFSCTCIKKCAYHFILYSFFHSVTEELP